MARLRNQRVPTARERQFRLDADYSVVVIFRASPNRFAGLQYYRPDRLDHWRPFKFQIVRDGWSPAGRSLYGVGFENGSQVVQIDGFRNIIKVKNPKMATQGNRNPLSQP